MRDPEESHDRPPQTQESGAVLGVQGSVWRLLPVHEVIGAALQVGL